MNDNTSYREKGRAVFLAAIMVLSVIAMSAAFAGSAAAAAPQSVQDVNLDDQAWWEGKVLNVSNQSETWNGEDTLQLRSVDDTEDGNVTDSSLVTELTGTAAGGGASDGYVEVDTDGLDGDYVIRADGDYIKYSDSVGAEDIVFEVASQDFSAEWEDDEVTETDNDSVVEFDSNRNSYNLTVAADDLDIDQLKDLFLGYPNDNPGLENVTDDEHLPLASLGYDRGDDTWADLEDDDYLTLNTAQVGTDELVANWTHLEDNAGVDEGEYEFTFYVTDSSAEDTATIEFREDDVDADFDQGVYTQTAGDLVEFTVELEDTNDAYIQIGDEDAGFVDVLYVEDDGGEDGEVNFWMNTRTAGVEGQAAYISGDDHVESMLQNHDSGTLANVEGLEDASFYDGDDHDGDGWTGFEDYVDNLIGEDADDQLDRPLQPTDYSITASSDGVFIYDDGQSEADDEIAAATLDLTSPEIGEISTHVAPQEDADADDLAELLGEDVQVTPRTDIAEDDRLIIEAEASGLFGALIANQSNDPGDLADGITAETLATVMDTSSGDDWHGEGINFEVVGDDAVGNQDPTTLDLSGADDEDIIAFADGAQSTLYVVVDTGSSDAWDGSIADGDTFTAELEYETDNDDRFNFESQGEFLGGADGSTSSPAYPYFGTDSDQSVSTEFDIVEPAAAFDNLDADDNVQIETGDGVVLTGETNVAPGSEADLRITNAGDTPSFLNTVDATIDSDGTFESEEIDFSDRDEDDEAALNFRVYGSSIDSADGIFVESIEDDADDDAPEEDDDVPEEDDEPPETDDEPPETDDDPAPPSDDDEPVDTEDDGVPGFGLAIAVVALLAAAMLALRRQN